MKITREYLKAIIKEEFNEINASLNEKKSKKSKEIKKEIKINSNKLFIPFDKFLP